MAMRRYSQLEIEAHLRRADTMRRDGAKIHEVARALGITDSTLYNWRKKYGASGAGEAVRAR